MKRKLLSLFLIMVLSTSLMPATALAATGDTGTTGIWNWTVLGDNTLAITGCTAPTGGLVLPDTLDCGSLGTLTVTTIEGYAFFKGSLQSITTPGSVFSIGEAAFSECANLETVTLNSGLEILDDKVFQGCEKLPPSRCPKR